MNIEDTINAFTNENGFCWGIDTAMKALRPGCLYSLSASGGTFEIIHWEEGQEMGPPSSQEIRDEYIRQQTIHEFLQYLKEKENKE